MTVVIITPANELSAQKYVQALDGRVQARLVAPEDIASSPEVLMRGAGGLLLAGETQIDSPAYGDFPNSDSQLWLRPGLDSLEMRLLRHGLELDMPVLAICGGMQLMNLAFGGGLLQAIPGHSGEQKNGAWTSSKHSLYLSPGSKLAAILGMGGFFKVNSLHHQGLKEAQKSPRLLASAYSLEDGLVEALESPDHSWVVGVQFHPELTDEVPKVFGNLFMAFADRVEGYGGLNGATGVA